MTDRTGISLRNTNRMCIMSTMIKEMNFVELGSRPYSPFIKPD